MKTKTCLWKFDDWHCYYDSDCGHAYCFDDEPKLEEDAYKFCPGCGKLIQVAPTKKDDEKEEPEIDP